MAFGMQYPEVKALIDKTMESSLEEIATELEKLCQSDKGWQKCAEFYSHSPRTWELLHTGIALPNSPMLGDVRVDPRPDWLASLPLKDVASIVASGRLSQERSQVFVKRLTDLLSNLTENQAYLIEIHEDNRHKWVLIQPNGLIRKLAFIDKVNVREGIYPTQPAPQIWFHLPDKNSFYQRGADIFEALQVVKASKKGTVRLTPEVVEVFGIHPEKGYPRFLFQLSAGAGKASFELPILANDEVITRLKALKLLQHFKEAVQDDAYWFDLQIGTTKAGNPRLQVGPPSATPAVLAVFFEVAKPEQSSAQVLWTKRVTSNGGGLSNSKTVAVIRQGQMVAMQTGVGYTFDGQALVKAPGAGLDQSE